MMENIPDPTCAKNDDIKVLAEGRVVVLLLQAPFGLGGGLCGGLGGGLGSVSHWVHELVLESFSRALLQKAAKSLVFFIHQYQYQSNQGNKSRIIRRGI